MEAKAIRVLCVEDNYLLVESLRRRLGREADIEVVGALSSADELVEEVERTGANCVIVDLNMAGREPLEVVAELSERHPEVRAVVLSGYVKREMVDRALDAGAAGYISKGEEGGALLDALRRVMAGEMVLSPEIRRFYSVSRGG